MNFNSPAGQQLIANIWNLSTMAVTTTLATGYPKAGPGCEQAVPTRRSIGTKSTTNGFNTRSVDYCHSILANLFAISIILKPTLLPAGRENACQRNLNGKWPLKCRKCKGILWMHG